jgi:acetylglutamate kinase
MTTTTRLLLKIGGAQLEQQAPRARFCRAVATARAAGHELVIVHGGGNQIRALTQRLGLPERYHAGLRVTDAATADAVLMVLAGQVNRLLTAALQAAGVAAAGICGADGGSFTATPLVRDGIDLGYVGQVGATDPGLVATLLGNGYVPVIATVAPGPGAGPFFNLNADHAAGPLCRAFGCDALLFLTDVPGVLDAGGRRLAALTPADCARLVADGTAHGGMLPKLEAALLALQENPRALIKIAPAAGDDCVREALGAAGTRFVTAVTTTTPDPDPAGAPWTKA